MLQAQSYYLLNKPGINLNKWFNGDIFIMEHRKVLFRYRMFKITT